jgi:4-methyl-5(b-hydroxyethyl)-thiazole monophosphate biosynthesis
MKKTAVIFAQGCEEGEALTIVDILRRAEIHCDILGLGSDTITGTHGITMKADGVVTGELCEYDMVILPGGYGGTDAMKEDVLLRQCLQEMAKSGKKIAAICAAPQVLEAAGLLEGKQFTCYPGVKDTIQHGTWCDAPVVIDGDLITGQGPALVYAFAYTIVDALDKDSDTVKKRMAYHRAFDTKEDA